MVLHDALDDAEAEPGLATAPRLLVVKNASEKWSRASGAMPGPVSLILKSTYSPAAT